jgi:glycolate oxidase FAD binding subunit
LGGPATAIAQATQKLLDSPLTPTALDLLTPSLLAATGLSGELGLAVRFQSLPASVMAQGQRLQALTESLALSSLTLSKAADQSFWDGLQTQLWGDRADPPAVVVKLGVLPARSAHLLATFWVVVAQDQGMELHGRIHAGSGLGVIRFGGEPTPELLQELRSHCQQAQGFLTVLGAAPELKQAIEIWGYTGNALNSMRKIKEQFDPQSLFNPGRFVDRL